MIAAQIVSFGAAVPEKVLTNADLEKLVDTSDEWIRTRTGISQRHLAASGETSSDLGAKAALQCLARAGVDPKELDLIIVATATPDHRFPATACYLQRKIGAQGCAAFDVVAVCAGFLVALSTAKHFIAGGCYRHVLVVGAETFSRVVDWQDRNTCVLFGDGAAAALVTAGTDPDVGIVGIDLYANGDYAEALMLPGMEHDAASFMAQDSAKSVDRSYVQMSGQDVFKHAVRELTRSSRTVLKTHGLTTADIDYFVPHQANIRIINAVAKAMKLPAEKVVSNIAAYGNTSAASIGIALNQMYEEKLLKKNTTVLIAAIGGGLNWGAGIIRF